MVVWEAYQLLSEASIWWMNKKVELGLSSLSLPWDQFVLFSKYWWLSQLYANQKLTDF